MARYVAFLRGINVGGHTVKMEDLKLLFTELKFQNVETLIASGNVIFETKSGTAKALEAKIAAHLKATLGFEVPTFLRTMNEIHDIANHQPFDPDAAAKAHGIYVGLMADPCTPATSEAVMKFRTAIDDFHCTNREVYWLCHIPLVDSKFSYKAFEKIIKGPATFRNLKTMARLAVKYPI